ncbi:transmembrane protein, putative (macronuclear) [Tetrahymena thermophila SB210]|uniref:Transmembrane protein, putative n=1 Tax=Tetrahymena thermophila (strain SB210) TaxID=312017 RepID=Q23WT3_TETTS|nr:transmembrane protein, putative [Tetrahymena thermophila SB210]EAS01012.2 transmembrane protein, putative [Tetrahymena thermophila SB210]|eukprot:XP_001021257.2 transmembrane protein, putative [Tetrahymena thermophila SB210]
MFVEKKIQICGFKCSQCDFFGNCLQCEEGYIPSSGNGYCQSYCGQQNEYLNQELGQCNPICGYGYYEQRDYYVCQKSQKCPSINEFGNNLKQIIGSTLVGSELAVFCKTFNSTNNQYNFFLRIYDSDLNFKGEMQQLTDEVKQFYLDQQNKYFITVSLQEINFWQIPTCSLTPINDSYLFFGDIYNNIVIWQNGVCSPQNISATSPIQNYFVFYDNLSTSFLYIIAAGSTQYYELTTQSNNFQLQLLKTTNMNGTYNMYIAQDTLYVRNNFTFSIYTYQNKSLVKMFQGNSSNPDNQLFENIFMFNNQVYEFYMNSIFINEPAQQIAQQENQVTTCNQVKKSENINFYQPTTVDAINQIILDPNYDGQLVIAGNDGSIRVYELTSFEDLSYIHIFTQYHPICNQQSIMQKCLQANNITISDLGYYYVFVMIMPNFQTNHVLSFYNTIKSIIVDEDKLILYIGFVDGQIYVFHIILNYAINLNQFISSFYNQLQDIFGTENTITSKLKSLCP